MDAPAEFSPIIRIGQFQHAMRPAPRILRRNPNGIEKIFKESDGAGNVYRIFVNSYDVM